MLFPEQHKMYCKKCKKHTLFKSRQYKAGQKTLHSKGDRRYIMKQKGYGGQTRPIFKKKKKTTRKISTKSQCNECSFTIIHSHGRIAAFEITKKRKRTARTHVVLG
eukprot:130006_1